jgi:Ran GTPase-activating protein (RanGAP) involved in mRNA processing and transport
LQKYTAVTDIELRGNSIGSEGITVISNIVRTTSTLRSISLEWNKLGSGTDMGLQKFLVAVGENRSLQKVDLSNNEIGPEAG